MTSTSISVCEDNSEPSDLEIALSGEEVKVSSNVSDKNIFQKIKNWYFEPRSLEKWENGRMYELLGVGFFKKYLPTWGDYVSDKLGYHPIIQAKNREEGLREYDTTTQLYEAIHLPCCLVATPVIALMFASGGYKYGAVILAINLPLNYYPLFVQRYNRTRIYNLLNQMENRKDTNHIR